MKKINIGTDFSGIEAPVQALIRLGIPFRHVFSCDNDKYVRQSIRANYHPETLYEDITTRDHSKIEPLDFYVAGFPCQAFSISGKRRGFDDIRGTLFFNTADFIRINRPKVFVLENVKGLLSHDKPKGSKEKYGRTFKTIINVLGKTWNGQHQTSLPDDNLGYHIYWQVLNAKQHGLPQNRERIFIVGFRDDEHTFSFPKPIPLIKRIKHIREQVVDEKYYLSDKMLAYFLNRAGNFNNGKINFKNDGDIASCRKAASKSLDISDNILVVNQEGNLKGSEIANCIDANYHKGMDNHAQRSMVIHPANNSDQLIQLGNVDEKGHNSLWGRVYSPEGIGPTLNAGGVGVGAKTGLFLMDGTPVRIRKLTPLECFRLQGFPDQVFHNCTKGGLSDTQLYKQAGNSMAVDCVAALFNKIMPNFHPEGGQPLADN